MRTLARLKPRPKVAAGGVAGAVTTILIWVLSGFGIEVPGEVGAAFTTLFTFLAGWLKAE